MRLALLDHNLQLLPTAVQNIRLEMAYRLRKRLPLLASRPQTLRAVDEVLSELEQELRDRSKRL